MTTVDPKDLKPGDWFVWHELKPPRYRVVEPLGSEALRLLDDGTILAEDERNIAIHGPGGFPPSAVSVADRRFERAAPPDQFRRQLPDQVGTTIVAQVLESGKLRTTLAVLEYTVYGPKWTENGSGEWINPINITDWRLLDGLDTVRPEQGQLEQ